MNCGYCGVELVNPTIKPTINGRPNWAHIGSGIENRGPGEPWYYFCRGVNGVMQGTEAEPEYTQVTLV